MRLQFTHVHSFACRCRLRNLLADCSLLRNNNTAINLQTFTLSHGNRRFSISRPGYLGLIMKNRVKSVFFLSDKFISNFSVFNNMKITLHYSVCMSTSGEREVLYVYRI